MFLKKKRFSFKKFEDLIGLRGDIPPGGSFGDKFDKYSKKYLTISEVKDKHARIKRLLLGRSHYFVSDYYDSAFFLHKKGLNDKIVPLPKVISKIQVYFAISRKSKCPNIAADITNYIERFKNDGTLKSFKNKYRLKHH
ncbi:MAG: transporter substrate-binding domain-containing protein [Deltaproteobacteria bacterium]|nr:transporter substrate-binding domain-containing protein [Deltaproteobacteria bacterium]